MNALFRFPRTKFVDEKGIAGQMLHIGSELMEFELELLAGRMREAMIELLVLPPAGGHTDGSGAAPFLRPAGRGNDKEIRGWRPPLA